MNKHKLAISAFVAITLITTACKKNDLKHQPANQKTTETAATSQWKSVSTWSNSKQDEFTVFSGKIEDNNITSEVVSKGLVLVYKSNGANVLTLPGEDKNANNYWYYQVSKGSVIITSDVYGAAAEFDQSSTFQYFILTKEKVAELEAQGYSKAKLMSLSHADASQLLAK